MSDPFQSLCPTCGAPLEIDGSCPRCLMLVALEPTAPSGETSRHPPPSLEAVAAAFPQLEILELIGEGGMGCVFKARQPKLNRLVALKLLPASLAERDLAFAERFEREGQLLARLHHPNIVAVHDSGTAGEFFYLIMEFVDGVNLRQAMRARRFTPAQALAIVPHICDALQYAHDQGVLHRDIKPENILLDAKGRVKLADFGIAKLLADFDTLAAATSPAAAGLTHSGTTLGTPSYMAPEQRDTPNDIDHRADIYSLGVVFYELLTGELPRERFTPPSAKSDADPRVDAIVQQALEKERGRRQHSAGEVKTQVEKIGSAAGIAPASAVSRQPVAATILGIVLLVLAIAVPTAGMIIHNRSIQLLASEQQRRIVLLQQEFNAASAQIGDANGNAGRAASRAGNSVFPEEVRTQAREEQELHEQRAARGKEQLALVNAKFAATTATQVDAKPWRAMLILLTMLPFAITGVALLVRSVRGVGEMKTPLETVDSTAPIGQRNRPKISVWPTLVLHAVILALITAFFGVTIPRFADMFSDIGLALPQVTRLTFKFAHFWGVLTFPLVLGLDAGVCYLMRELGGRRALRIWSGTVIIGLVLIVAMSSAALFLPMRTIVTELNPRVAPAAGATDSGPHSVESWSYTPRHLTAAKFVEWQKSAKGERAELSEGTSFQHKSGVFTFTGPRERVRLLATMLRVIDQPEVKDPLQLPILNMPPDFFLRIAFPTLILQDDFAKAPFTDALLDSLKREGIAAPQLGRALSAHVLELEKATFVNSGPPFESIVRSPGASTFYEGTIPCADQPDKPLTLRIERTTQQMGTQSKFAGFAPWLIEEAKQQSKEPLDAARALER